MPYIDPLDRDEEAEHYPTNVGELTYSLTTTCLRYLGDYPMFSTYAAVVAALECTKLELYRRSVANYEDGKRRENGDLLYPHRAEQ